MNRLRELLEGGFHMEFSFDEINPEALKIALGERLFKQDAERIRDKMNWINIGRRAGKTTMLVHTAAVTYLPIVTLDKARKEIVEGTARREGLEVKAFTLKEWSQCGYSRHEEGCLVDEAATIIPTALERLLGCKVAAITTSIPIKENTRLKKEDQKETEAAGDLIPDIVNKFELKKAYYYGCKEDLEKAYQQGKAEGAREFAEWLLINHTLDCIECNHGDRTIGCKECANEYLAEWQKEQMDDIKRTNKEKNSSRNI